MTTDEAIAAIRKLASAHTGDYVPVPASVLSAVAQDGLKPILVGASADAIIQVHRVHHLGTILTGAAS